MKRWPRRVTSHESRVTARLAIVLAAIAILANVVHPTSAQESLPLIVDAQQVVYDDATQTVEATGNVSLSYRGIRVKADVVHVDLREERVEARGHVAIVDSVGREMRGDVLTYRARDQIIEVTS